MVGDETHMSFNVFSCKSIRNVSDKTKYRYSTYNIAALSVIEMCSHKVQYNEGKNMLYERAPCKHPASVTSFSHIHQV